MKRLAVAAVVVAGALVSSAANGTWTGTSGNVWAADGNWDAAPYPQGDETATFASGGGAVDLAGIRSLTFTGAAFTLRFAGTVTAPSPGAKTVTVRGSGPVEFAGDMVKGGSSILDMTVEGTGPISLSGASNVLRTVNLNGPAGGVLDIGAGAPAL